MEIFQEFKKQFINFLNSDNRIVLTKGMFHEIKLLSILAAIETQSQYSKGTLNAHSKEVFKDLTEQGMLTKEIPLNTTFTLNDLSLQLNLYTANTPNFGEFAIYYPVNPKTIKGKNIEILVNHIKDNPASKVFIITANDWEFNSKVSKTLEEMSDIVVGEDLKQGIHEIFNSGFNNGN
ncbi:MULTISPECIES: hypothetical protein [Mammaliicoccus]|uniref:hypothetical protein n=1 Tax=Mammaliicoccus TaxID=2803850 RepID=UPI000D1F7EDF|nr:MULTISPECIES: hypothetical protein [Mammaliicoccus]MCE5058003.1 hypothetical protein [Mammaliicoccus sciuri]MEB5649307.1 hypothetical protein [Mammaliicoccus sciuri]MEB6213951.1 hypothetical protein [Mammaliicoccus sciuri]MEB6255356.1 hypothetical protein [Mammaliicoccus sciuri]MEB6329066.1 hypothetical protein [Mammaliicoccus sciuri]